MKQEFNIQLDCTRNGEEHGTIEFTISALSPKSLEEVQRDFSWWREEVEALAARQPESDDEYAMLFEKRGYTVSALIFDLVFKV